MLHVSMDMKMYVRWKALLGWGIALWLLLCLHDAFFADPVIKEYYSNTHEDAWLAEPVESASQLETEDLRLLEVEAEDNWNFWLTLLFWNAFAFSTSLALCAATKFAVSLGWKYKQDHREETVWPSKNLAKLIDLTCYKNSLVAIFSHDRATQKSAEVEEPQKSDPTQVAEAEILSPKLSMSKIPILLSKSGSASKLLVIKDQSHFGSDEDEHANRRTRQFVESSASDYYNEKQRFSGLSLPSSVLKEQARLSKKLDTLSRENIDIHKQLVAEQRECREVKSQLEDVVREKANLIEKLENATNQLNAINKSKNIAIAKLEQSEALVRDLKYQLEKRVFQNESLKQQMSSIENSLLNMCENGGDDVSINLSSSQQSFGKEQKANDDLIESQWDTNEFSQSQRHAKKVQMRMRNLEKCIQNLNITTWPSEDSISRGGRYSPDIDYKDMGVMGDMSPTQGLTMRTKSECPFVDEIIMNHQMYSSEDSTVSADMLHTHQNYMKKYCGMGATDEDYFYLASTEEESNDEYGRHREGLITTSPAFKQFLRNMPVAST